MKLLWLTKKILFFGTKGFEPFHNSQIVVLSPENPRKKFFSGPKNDIKQSLGDSKIDGVDCDPKLTPIFPKEFGTLLGHGVVAQV